MKNLLALAAFVALLVVAVGYFCGWYRIHTDPAPEGQNRVTIDINAQKVKQDVDQAKDKVKDILNKKDEPKQSSSAAPSSGTPTPPPLPPGIDLTTEVPSLPPIPAAPPGTSIPAAPPSGNYGLPPASPSGPPALPGQPKSEEFYNFPPPAPPQN